MVRLLLSSPGLSMSRSKNGVASLAYVTPLKDALTQCPPKRDGRVKPGHDSHSVIASKAKRAQTKKFGTCSESAFT